ncbi:uncharacterized protein LOC126682035 [Mercurialis annua]|uniref:uncharacterized protein LOC126682035 n=1 Tax=Mercurialis annua TaxID=3986 RepID=UPI00215E84BE|nr:uncharacterized protein LOC126682035 [Mercurialis annua]
MSIYVSSSRSTHHNENTIEDICQQKDQSTNNDDSNSVSSIFQYANDMGRMLNEDQEVQSPYMGSLVIDEIKEMEIEEECQWRLRASRSKKTDMFIVRKFNKEHTCKVADRMADKRQATSKLIGNFIKDKYTNFKTVYTPADIIRDMKKEYGVELSYQRAWKSKEKGLDLTRGNPAESYQLLPSYLHALKTTNPGTVTELETRENRFLYVFISLNASIKGWGFCKPIIVVDGTFLKAAYGGTLLTAATQDAANKIFPLAFCVVDSENNESWEWFFYEN